MQLLAFIVPAHICVLLTCAAQAAVELPQIFADHAVLQAGQPVPVWGKAAPGEAVAVQFADQKKSAIADAQGKWSVKLDAMPPSTEPRAMTVQGTGAAQTRSDILVGEVWLCSGQSNMVMPLGSIEGYNGVIGGETEIARPEQPELRLFSGGNKPEWWEGAGLSGWQRANPASRRSFSATAYFFGVSLQSALRVPVGLINISAGGSPISPWIPRETAVQLPFVRFYREVLSQNQEEIRGYDERMERYFQVMGDRTANIASARNPPPVMPDPLGYLLVTGQRVWNFGLYERYIAPVVPFAIRGVIWYQGESNADNLDLSRHYEEMLRTLINAWREKWEKPHLPFYFVQLPCWEDAESAKTWHVNRQSMLNALRSMTDVGMVVTADVGDIHDLHPPNKRPVGERLALWALAKTYGRAIVYSGPLVHRITAEGNRLRISFDTFGSPLDIHGKSWMDLEVAGADGLYYPATAIVAETDAIVSSPSVPKPVSVRYGWRPVFTPTLFNREGLPASPFSFQLADPK